MRYSYDFSAAALSLLALSGTTSAFWRMPCPGSVLRGRYDPIVNPGAVSGHVHTISGGNGFNFTMDYEQARESTCSSCPIKQDLSNYWTPSLYYQHQNGSFENVPQSGDGQGVYGGMTVYYLQRPGPNNDNLTAFPEGFRMLAGDPYKRSAGTDFASEAISYVCLDYDGTSSQYNHLPNKTCPDGVRAQVFFPSCWDGVNLDSSDHKSHMAYPTKYSYDNGPCPSTHPVHMISIFYEVIYSTAGFEWYSDTQPFVFADGDPLGYGFHGDFVNGWDVELLQEATDKCTNLSGIMEDCDLFEFFTGAESQACILAPMIDEQITGVMDKLPGCNNVTYGPDEAPKVAACPATVTAAKSYSTNVTGWDYVGCGSDNASNRTFSAASYSSSSMTVESCLTYCSNKGYHYAGLEYADECYCSNALPADRAPVTGVLGNCLSTCAGNSSEYCGGASRLSMYYTSTPATSITCPDNNGTQYTNPNGTTFEVSCGLDYSGGDLSTATVTTGIQGCIDTCGKTAKCVAVSLSGTQCYMKSKINTPTKNSGVNGAKMVSASTASSSTSTSSSKTSTSTSASTSKTSTSTGTSTSASTTTTSKASTTTSSSSVSSSTSSATSTTTKTSTSSVTSTTTKTSTSSVTSTTTKTSTSTSTSTTSSTTSSKASTTSSAQSTSTQASTTTGTSSISTAGYAMATSTVLCPNNNNTLLNDTATGAQFLIQCGTDHSGGDLSMVYVKAGNLTQCIAACANTTSCVDVSLSGSACYMKKSVGAPVYSNSGIHGAKLYKNATITSSTVAANAKAAATSSSSSSSSKSSSSTTVTTTTSTKTSSTTSTTTTKATTTTTKSSTTTTKTTTTSVKKRSVPTTTVIKGVTITRSSKASATDY